MEQKINKKTMQMKLISGLGVGVIFVSTPSFYKRRERYRNDHNNDEETMNNFT